MNYKLTPSAKLPQQRSSVALSESVAQGQLEREAALLSQQTEMLFEGKLLRHLQKQTQTKSIACDRFGRIAGEISSAEAETSEDGILVRAYWKVRYSESNKSAIGMLLSMFFGPLALLALLTRGDETKETGYSTIHRLPMAVYERCKAARPLLMFGQVVGVILGTISIIWAIVAWAMMEPDTETASTITAIFALVCMAVAFYTAYHFKVTSIPKSLRIYGVKGSNLESLMLLKDKS
ncbi:MAG: hypothetical protein AAFX93_06380 [Verrucomicrobiota bacterium]